MEEDLINKFYKVTLTNGFKYIVDSFNAKVYYSNGEPAICAKCRSQFIVKSDIIDCICEF